MYTHTCTYRISLIVWPDVHLPTVLVDPVLTRDKLLHVNRAVVYKITPNVMAIGNGQPNEWTCTRKHTTPLPTTQRFIGSLAFISHAWSHPQCINEAGVYPHASHVRGNMVHLYRDRMFTCNLRSRFSSDRRSWYQYCWGSWQPSHGKWWSWNLYN